MGEELVSITAGGAEVFFEEFEVHAAFNKGARSFSVEVAADRGAAETNRLVAVGKKVSINANGSLLMIGYINCKEPSFTPTSFIISISGRSASADLIDGAAEHETGQFENKDPLEIAQAISSEYEAKWESDQQLEKLEQYQVTPGETCYRCVEKMVRSQGMTITATPEGNAKITKPMGQRHSGGLIEGQNILAGSGAQNDSNRYSKTVVRGQRPFGHGDDATEVEAVEMDNAVKRHRTIIVIQDEDTTKERAEKRAKTRKDRAAGDAMRATLPIQGFRDQGGTLWTPGHLVWTEVPSLDIAQDMLVETVTFRQGERGSIAVLGLVDPRAYDGEGAGGGVGNQSGDEWDFE